MNNYARWKNFTQEELEEIVSSSKSNREVSRKLGYEQAGGGTLHSLSEMYKKYNLDTSHFTGQGWNEYHYESFSPRSYKKNGKSTREALINIRGNKCESCGLSEWNGQPINLEVHHINGDRTDNRLENLKLLCPNCHSYMPTFCKQKDKKPISDEDFVDALNGSNNIHKALEFLNLTPTAGNYTRAYRLIEDYNIEHLKKK